MACWPKDDESMGGVAMGPKPRPIEERFWGKVAISDKDDCWLWAGARFQRGYGKIYSGGKSSRLIRAHRVAYELTYGSIPNQLHVLHKCDNPPCVNPRHLFLGTQLDNNRDRYLKGRSRGAKGQSNCNAKLTDDDVRQIHRFVASGDGPTRIAKRYKVSRQLIWQISTGKIWGHVKPT